VPAAALQFHWIARRACKPLDNSTIRPGDGRQRVLGRNPVLGNAMRFRWRSLPVTFQRPRSTACRSLRIPWLRQRRPGADQADRQDRD
jgi:hypothetical protein